MTDPRAVQNVLEAVSSWNDRVQARLFDPGRRLRLGPQWRPGPDAVSPLVAAAQAGDAAAWHAALTSLLPALRGVVQRHLADPAAAEAALQEALLQVHALRATCDPRRPATRWAAAIADAVARRAAARAAREPNSR